MAETQYSQTLKISPKKIQLIDMNLVSYIKMLDGTIILISPTTENDNIPNSFKNEQFPETNLQNNQTSPQTLNIQNTTNIPSKNIRTNFAPPVCFTPQFQTTENSTVKTNQRIVPKTKNLQPKPVKKLRGRRGNQLVSNKQKPSIFKSRPKMIENEDKHNLSLDYVTECPICGKERLNRSIDNNYYYFDDN